MTQTLPEILKERGERYGAFRMHAKLSQDLKNAMANHDNWHRLEAIHQEALQMIQHKIARIINGDPDYLESFRDISGYAQLVMQELEQTERATDAEVKFKTRTKNGWVYQGEARL